MNLNFSKLNGLVPAIIQDYTTKQVLMLGFMNKEAYETTVEKQLVTFYSRTKQRLWTKGEDSGHVLRVKTIQFDCDADSLLITCQPEGPTCHTGQTSCFGEQQFPSFLHYLEVVIANRATETNQSSYTKQLLSQGIHKIAQKVGEEAIETILEATTNNSEHLQNEIADLLYHLLVLMKAKQINLQQVEQVLADRHN